MGIILSEVMDQDYLLEHGLDSLGSVLKHLTHDCLIEGAKELARRMNAFARKKLGRKEAALADFCQVLFCLNEFLYAE